MPVVDDHLPVIGCNRLRFGQITQLDTLRLSQLNPFIQIEHRLASSAANMDMNRGVLIAVEKEHKTVFLQNFRYSLNMAKTEPVGQSQHGTATPPMNANGNPRSRHRF